MATIRKTLLCLAGAWLLVPATNAQVWMSEVLSPTRINRYEGHHLVLVDFWATWCAPCINMGRQLENTQELFAEDLTIISLTQEAEPVVRNFIEKHHPRLTVALDDDGRTFAFYGVNRTLPYAVLLDPQGRILWQGHPADLSHPMIGRFILDNKGGKGKTILHQARERKAPAKQYDPQAFAVKPSASEELYFMLSEEGVAFNGPASRLLSEILRKPLQLIRVVNDPLISARIGILEWEKGGDHVMARLLKELKMESSVVREELPCYRLTVKNRKLLWDDRQLHLGSTTGASLTGDESLSVDNATVAEFAFRFSGVMDRLVITDDESPDLHDWQVHYRYWDLTVQQLSNEYGIRLEPKTAKADVLVFR